MNPNTAGRLMSSCSLSASLRRTISINLILNSGTLSSSLSSNTTRTSSMEALPEESEILNIQDWLTVLGQSTVSNVLGKTMQISTVNSISMIRTLGSTGVNWEKASTINTPVTQDTETRSNLN